MPRAAPPDAASSPPWMDLPLDLLRDISGRLHAATDYVHFYAVCKPWRDTLPPPRSRPALLPWLVAPRDATGHRKARCVLSSKSSPHRAAATEICIPDRRWVISANDGTATCWLQTTSGAESSGPVEPLTGSATATPVPRYPGVEIRKWEERPIGVSSGDGTVVVYAFGPHSWNCNRNSIDVALRHPGDGEWTLVQRDNAYAPDMCLAYRKGKIILCEADMWRIVSTKDAADDGRWRWIPDLPGKVFASSYLVESREQLLWASVQVNEQYYHDVRVGTIDNLASALSVSVYALQEAEDGKPQWVRRDGRSLSDRVLFLGRPSSVAIDAVQFGMSGRGCAYFIDRKQVYGGIWSKSPHVRCRVFKYSFLDETAELVEQLPEEWAAKDCTWITPQLAIASTEEIRERVQPKHKKAADAQQQFGTSYRIYVGNLPRKVDSYQLREFFSKHGKVADARVMHERRTGRSRGFGFVTMATTMEEEPANTVAKLNGQCLDGRPLRVKFADQ